MNNPRDQQREPRLGIDIGGVLSPMAEDVATSAPLPGAIEALARLEARFGPRRYLVSKAGPHVERKTLRWLAELDFFGRTGIPRRNVVFCRERSDKAPICERLRITRFMDDRLEILGYLRTIVPTRILFVGSGPPPAIVPAGIQVVTSWAEAERLLARDAA